jgi:hypothetical protein
MEVGETKTFNYTGAVQSILLIPGIYTFNAYGASGGGGVVGAHNHSSVGGMGGRATATFKILTPMTVYVYVGGAGFYGGGSSSYGGPTGGWNGGGNGGNSSSGSGGGATDFRLTGGAWNNTQSLYSRFLVAGGGGGADNWHSTGTGAGSGDDGSGGSGGGLEGQGAWISGGYRADYRGTQTSGYALGQGGHVTTNTDTGGAGGGWYGGKVTNNNNGGAGGGSGYIKGYPSCNTAYHSYQQNVEYYENGSFALNARSGNGLATIRFDVPFDGPADVYHYVQSLDLQGYTLESQESINYHYETSQDIIKNLTGFTYSKQEFGEDSGRIQIKIYYTRNTYTLTLDHGTSQKYTYLYEEQGDLHYDKHPTNYLHKFKNWISDIPANIDLAYLHDTFFKMPASDLTISAEFTDQDRVNTNIYKNIFDSFLFDLYNFQTILNGPYKQETTIFQYNHGFQIYDLLRLNQSGLYEKGIATESKYDVIGMVTQILNNHEFVLTTYGPIETNISFSSDSGILYLSDTQEGKFCTYEELASNFYTPIGFYTGNTITLNILDSSVGDVLKKYCDTVYEHERNLPYITETDKQDIIQEVFNNA